VLQSTLKETYKIVFNGDGYSDDWQKEAAKRGLLNLKTTMDAIPYLVSKKNLSLFERFKVLSHAEVEARSEIQFEQYFKTINIEGETTENMSRTMIIPAAVRYLNELVAVVERSKAVGIDAKGAATTLGKVNGLLNELVAATDELGKQNAELGGDDIHSKASHVAKNVLPAMNAVRAVADQLEKVVADDFWPLPTYRDMLFVR
jgi:glutamine synthetase